MQILVTARTAPVFPSGQQSAQTLFNGATDGTVIYIGSNSSVTLGTGFPLSAGSMLVWDAHRPLYACANGNAMLYTVENEGAGNLGTVGLAPGSSVALASGATVGLAAGSMVDASGSTVKVAPDQSRFWPCLSGESYPPTFGTSVGYATVVGQPCVNATVNTTATWGALARYAPNDVTTPLVVTGLLYLPNVSSGTNIYIGLGNAPGTLGASLSANCNGATSAIQLRIDNANVGTPFNINATTWHAFQLVYTPTLTRLTIDNDAVNKRVSGTAPTTALQPFIFSTLAGAAVSNIYATYPSAVPA